MKTTGSCLSNPSSAHGRPFCASSNRLLGSMLIMFLKGRLSVVACAFHIQPAKRSLRMSTKLAFLPTFVLPLQKLSSLCATRWFGSHCLQSGAWASLLLPVQGCQHYPVLVKTASQTVGHQTSSCNICFCSKVYIFKGHKHCKVILSQNPISAVK